MLGYSTTEGDQIVPNRVSALDGHVVTSVSAGGWHTITACVDGVYVFGYVWPQLLRRCCFIECRRDIVCVVGVVSLDGWGWVIKRAALFPHPSSHLQTFPSH